MGVFDVRDIPDVAKKWGGDVSKGWQDLAGGFSGENQAEAIEAAAASQAEATKEAARLMSEAGIESARIQKSGIDAALAQQLEQWNTTQGWMKPYMEAGETGLEGIMAMSGLSGDEAQASMLAGIEDSPYFASLVSQGENALLQNASATGGVRGGNIEGVLARYRPQMLKEEIENKYSKLAQIAGMGQATTVGGVSAGQNYGSNMANTTMGGSTNLAQLAMSGASNLANIAMSGAEAQSNAAMAAASSRNNMWGNLMMLAVAAKAMA